MGRPSFSPPPKKQWLHVNSGQGKVGCVFPQTINHMHNSFSPPDNLLLEVDAYLVRVGKEWASPVFPHPLKSKGYMCIHDRVSLTVFFRRELTICITDFPHLITLCIKLMFNLVKVGIEWASPVFPHSLQNQRLHVYSWQGKVVYVFPQTINHMHNSFSLPDNLLHEVDV